MSFFTITALVLVILKLMGELEDWSWWLILAPI